MAVEFQTMPPLSADEYNALTASVRDHGIQVPVLTDEHGTIIDGHHRWRIAEELGIECPTRAVAKLSDTEKRTLSLSLNLDRRHLTREQRRALVRESLTADPQLSDRQHAERARVSPTTAGSARRELESEGRLSSLDSRTSADGRSRPASQPSPPTPAPVSVTTTQTTSETHVADPATGEVLDEPLDFEDDDDLEVSEQIERLNAQVAAQAPTPEHKPRRRPLPDALRDATYEIEKRVESLGRLVNDDRFPTNKEQVAPRLRNDLLRIQVLLQQALDVLNEGNSTNEH